jgi:competence protein ComEC
MPLTGLGFLLGIMWAIYLPDTIWPGLVLLLFPGIWLGLGWLRLMAFIFAGLIWVTVYMQWFHLAALPVEMDGQTVTVSGEIASIPEVGAQRARFDFDISQIHGIPLQWQQRVRLSWYYPKQKLRPGQFWKLDIKLKPAHGFANPGGFDYERWLFSRGIAATGYVRNTDSAGLMYSRVSLHLVRQILTEKIRTIIPQSEFGGLLIALVTGNRQFIEPYQWDVLSRTGTIHLMAISGLHVGLVYGLFFWLGRVAWQSSAPLCVIRPAQDVGVILGLFAALIYAALAGFSVPTLRALIMLSVVVFAVLTRRLAAPFDVLQSALLLVLVLDPLAVLSTGFWLSFLAVGLILQTLAKEQQAPANRASRIYQLVKIQWFLMIGMLPLSSLIFNQVSLMGPVMNLVAVPLVGLLVVPLSLTGAALAFLQSQLAAFFLYLADMLMNGLWWLLDMASSHEYAVMYLPHLPAWVLLLGSLGIVLLLFQRSVSHRIAGMLMIMPLFVVTPVSLKAGEFQVDFLDVGQGLSVVVRTATRTLLYDTGFSNDESFDIGRSVIIPYLRHQGVKQLDHVVLSHDDRDHIGGYQSISNDFSIERLTVMPGSRYLADSGKASTCGSGDFWQWDGVEFRFLHPDTPIAVKENDRSCVLRISGPGGSVLLAGDIEEIAERMLVSRFRENLRADILLAPHHGSATSSSTAFIDRVRPREVVYSAGYRNRFGFPRALVAERYRAHGVQQLNTAHSGMLRYQFGLQPGSYHREIYRQEHRKIWHQVTEH